MSEVMLQGSAPDASADEQDGDPEDRALRVGDVVAGKYLLVSYLARGGMAEVWLATHRELKTEVAIKFVHEHLSTDDAGGEWALERFRFEAQISARLAARTKHIVAVLDAGTHEGMPYLVMEYVPGTTLEAEVEQNGPIPVERYADILDQVADGLEAAHTLGIIHRDLKPSNFLIHDTTGDGGSMIVKLADFGVAKAVDTTLAVDRPRETQRGEVVGSPAFMSPEQLRGVGELNSRSDIWSLGVVTYEMVTGAECFEGKTIMDTFAAISMRRYRPPSTVFQGLPRGFDAWMDRALAESPDARFPNVTEMARAYRAMIQPPARRTRVPIAIGAALLSALILSAALLARGRAESVPAPPVVTNSPPPNTPNTPNTPASPPNPRSGLSTTTPAVETATLAATPPPGPPVTGRTRTTPPPTSATSATASPSPPPGSRGKRTINPSEIQ